MRSCSSYFDSYKIDKELQIEVRKYLEYKFQADTELSLEEKENVLK